ncbi:hypothetical protein, partial [Rodentibacter ratti]|uniref:hypothetical protein n=1 Tax=Rodentibacter ratti TaxID=1906745 RepID=UPI001C4DE689
MLAAVNIAAYFLYKRRNLYFGKYFSCNYSFRKKKRQEKLPLRLKKSGIMSQMHKNRNFTECRYHKT